LIFSQSFCARKRPTHLRSDEIEMEILVSDPDQPEMPTARPIFFGNDSGAPAIWTMEDTNITSGVVPPNRGSDWHCSSPSTRVEPSCGGIPVTPAIGPGDSDQPIDLGAGQVLAGPVVGVPLPSPVGFYRTGGVARWHWPNDQ